jgi:hypothetical protein
MSHGPQWHAGPPWSSNHGRLGLAGVMPFSRFGRRELAATKGRGIGEWRSPHRGQNRPARCWGEAGGEEDQAAAVAISDGRLWSMKG